MSTVGISEENVLKAYESGCDDVKKVLRTLFPTVMGKKEWIDISDSITLEDGRLKDPKTDLVIFDLSEFGVIEVTTGYSSKHSGQIRVCSGISEWDYKLEFGKIYRRKRS